MPHDRDITNAEREEAALNEQGQLPRRLSGLPPTQGGRRPNVYARLRSMPRDRDITNAELEGALNEQGQLPPGEQLKLLSLISNFLAKFGETTLTAENINVQALKEDAWRARSRTIEGMLGDLTEAERAGLEAEESAERAAGFKLYEQEQRRLTKEKERLEDLNMPFSERVRDKEVKREEYKQAVQELLGSSRYNLPPGMQYWLQTNNAFDSINEGYQRSRDVTAIGEEHANFLDWMGDNVKFVFQEFIERGGDKNLLKDLQEGNLQGETPFLVSAIFDNLLAPQTVGLGKNVPAHIAMWAQSPGGRAAITERYLQNFQTTRALIDPAFMEADAWGLAINDPAQFVKQLDAESMVNLWSDAHPLQALEREAKQYAGAFPKFVYEGVLRALKKEWDTQQSQPGGTFSVSSFLQGGQKIREFERTIDLELRNARSNAASFPLIDPWFFKQTSRELLLQATANLRESMGREPEYDEVAREMQAIQLRQTDAFLAGKGPGYGLMPGEEGYEEARADGLPPIFGPMGGGWGVKRPTDSEGKPLPLSEKEIKEQALRMSGFGPPRPTPSERELQLEERQRAIREARARGALNRRRQPFGPAFLVER